jgi:hypothetical protein
MLMVDAASPRSCHSCKSICLRFVRKVNAHALPNTIKTFQQLIHCQCVSSGRARVSVDSVLFHIKGSVRRGAWTRRRREEANLIRRFCLHLRASFLCIHSLSLSPVPSHNNHTKRTPLSSLCSRHVLTLGRLSFVACLSANRSIDSFVDKRHVFVRSDRCLTVLIQHSSDREIKTNIFSRRSSTCVIRNQTKSTVL